MNQLTHKFESMTTAAGTQALVRWSDTYALNPEGISGA